MTESPLELTPPGERLTWPAAFRQVVMLSAPIVPAMLSQMLIGFSDNWMVSQMGVAAVGVGPWTVPLDTQVNAELGKTALAAVMPATLMCWGIMSLFVGTINIVNTFASQSLGRGEPAEAGRYGWQSIYFGLMTVAVVLAAQAAAPWFFGRYAPSPAVLANELAFFNLRMWSLPAVVIVSGLSAFFQGIHRPAMPAIIGVVSNVLNLALNWLLIFGRGGFPRMGVAGSAAASLISTAVGMVILVGWFLAPHVARRFGTWSGWRPSGQRIARLFWVGVPSGASWTLDMIGWIVLANVLIEPLGEVQAAASNAAMSYLQVGFMPVVGVAIAVNALVGKAMGQRRVGQARRFAAAGFAVAGGYQLLIGALMIALRYPLMRFFSGDPQVIQLGSYALVCAGVFQVFDAMGIIYTHALRGAGDTVFLLIAGLALICGLFVPLSWALTRQVAARYWPAMQAIAPWVAATIYVAALGAVMLARWFSRRWERIDIFAAGRQKRG